MVSFDDLFALRITLQEEYTDEADIIRQLKSYLLQSLSIEEIDEYLHNFYNSFGINIPIEDLRDVKLDRSYIRRIQRSNMNNLRSFFSNEINSTPSDSTQQNTTEDTNSQSELIDNTEQDTNSQSESVDNTTQNNTQEDTNSQSNLIDQSNNLIEQNLDQILDDVIESFQEITSDIEEESEDDSEDYDSLPPLENIQNINTMQNIGNIFDNSFNYQGMFDIYANSVNEFSYNSNDITNANAFMELFTNNLINTLGDAVNSQNGTIPSQLGNDTTPLIPLDINRSIQNIDDNSLEYEDSDNNEITSQQNVNTDSTDDDNSNNSTEPTNSTDITDSTEPTNSTESNDQTVERIGRNPLNSANSTSRSRIRRLNTNSFISNTRRRADLGPNEIMRQFINSNILFPQPMSNLLNRIPVGNPIHMEDVKVTLEDEEIENLKRIKFGDISNEGIDSDEKKCTICMTNYEDSDDILVTKCNHIFHEDCIKDWFKNYSYKCPVCRTECGKPKYHV